MMRLDESSLIKHEPYHIPGYRGYCPQFKYKINETFGKTTHDLLRSPDIRRSTRSVLSPLDCDSTSKKQIYPEPKRVVIREKVLSDQKYGEIMVPGYTGYIPKGEHYFGERYALFTADASNHMERDHRLYEQRLQRLQQLINRQETDGLSDRKYIKLPLVPITDKTKDYYPKFSFQHSLSPYTYANDDPRKYMLSGYTGFVPNSRNTIGMSYPDITNKALCEFTTASTENKLMEKSPVKRCPEKLCKNPLYVQNSGMVPHYTGHIPGEKFRYGKTFGHSTTNAILKLKQN